MTPASRNEASATLSKAYARLSEALTQLQYALLDLHEALLQRDNERREQLEKEASLHLARIRDQARGGLR